MKPRKPSMTRSGRTSKSEPTGAAFTTRPQLREETVEPVKPEDRKVANTALGTFQPFLTDEGVEVPAELRLTCLRLR